MKKKILSILAAFVVFGSVNAFALGIGAQAGVVGAGNFGGALTICLDKPMFWAISAAGSNNGVRVDVTGDYWMANPTISGPVSYFYGLGGAGTAIISDTVGVGAGIRAFIGLDFKPIKVFDVYLQAAYQPGLVVFLGNNSGFNFDFVNFNANLGFRFWL